ncbi:type VI secretion system transmembrane protein TssO [Chryseobacterium indologenes]|uniref:type VI secretion system transmembrane protein TssO n=1 Tax=Chryseobacterium indologenes TaxID=253 RepID=UPI00076E2E67|nr:type VI secretion system transmembrane protein TssO [Chryseobacterium indologenes]
MQGQITLSKKERHYQFLYLILMLLTAMIFLGVIFLKGFESPFSDEGIRGIQNLEQKAEFEQHQKIILPIMDSTYTMITKLTDETPQPFVENNIFNNINDLNGYFKNNEIADIRKDAYPQIARFYKMYFDDKKVISTTTEDIKKFEKQVEECRIGFKDKQNKLYDRENALKARTQ